MSGQSQCRVRPRSKSPCSRQLVIQATARGCTPWAARPRATVEARSLFSAKRLVEVERFFGGGADVSHGKEDERPPGQAGLPEFWIDKEEVAVRAYQQRVRASKCDANDLRKVLPCGGTAPARPSCNSWVHDNCPLKCGSWMQAHRYCESSARALVHLVRVGKAARGPTNSRRFSGEERSLGRGAPFRTPCEIRVGSRWQLTTAVLRSHFDV
jgi:formylglycine-generating enzyme required for sulfatase activity